MSQDLHPCIPN